MEALDSAFGRLKDTSNTLQAAIDRVDLLIKSVEDFQTQLQSSDCDIAGLTSQSKQSWTEGLDKLYNNEPKKDHTLKGMYGALNGYDKALKSIFKDTENVPEVHKSLDGEQDLIERSILLHFAREGDQELTDTFMRETTDRSIYRSRDPLSFLSGDHNFSVADRERFRAWRETDSPFRWQYCSQDPELHESFSTLNRILRSVQNYRELSPAIEWAQSRRNKLDNSASRIEFELCMLKYITILRQGGPNAVKDAWEFASGTLSQSHLWRQDSKRIQQLVCALAFPENLSVSPYNRIFDLSDAWDKIVGLISREFCIHMGIPSQSPLRTAVNAGVAGIPTLIKLQTVMKARKAEWSTSKELPVEIPLPETYIFHPIFVCPVSKEQATAENPPMMLPCGHVISKASVDNLTHTTTSFKCPYCPRVTDRTSIKEVYLK